MTETEINKAFPDFFYYPKNRLELEIIIRNMWNQTTFDICESQTLRSYKSHIGTAADYFHPEIVLVKNMEYSRFQLMLARDYDTTIVHTDLKKEINFSNILKFFDLATVKSL